MAAKFLLVPKVEVKQTVDTEEKKVTLDFGKDLVVSPEHYEKIVLNNPVRLSSLMDDPWRGKGVRIRCVRIAELTTNGSGALAITTSIVLSNMAQTTQLAALFQEYRLIKTKITYSPLVAPDPSATVNNFAVFTAFNPVAASFTTSTEVARLGNSKIWFGNNTARAHSQFYVLKRDPNPWAMTETGGSGSDPIGLRGAWCTYLDGAPASTAVLSYMIECWYEFRGLK
jgi:hypothetical protein